MEATTPPVRGGVAATTFSQPNRRLPIVRVKIIIPTIPPRAITTVFHWDKSSFKLIKVPIWVKSKYIDKYTTGLAKEL
jgi:hypothetical protein